MKKLISLDPKTLKPTVVCTFELVGKVVRIVPAAAGKRPELQELVGRGGKLLTPNDGRAYYAALDSIQGTYLRVVGG